MSGACSATPTWFASVEGRDVIRSVELVFEGRKYEHIVGVPASAAAAGAGAESQTERERGRQRIVGSSDFSQDQQNPTVV